MVQIIQRTRPTVGEQIGAGLGSGLQKGMSAALEFGREQKKMASDQKRKHELAEQIMNDPALKDLDPTIKRLLAFETAGLTSAQSTASATKAIRENASRKSFSDKLAGMGQNQTSEPPSQSGMQGLNDQLEINRPEIEKPSKEPKRNYNAEIKQLTDMLLNAETPQQQSFLESNIKELQNLRNIEQKQSEEASKRSFIPHEEYIKHASKENASFLDEVSQIEKDMPNTQFALAGIEDSLGNANKWAAFRDSIAERSGFEGARSAAGAELVSLKNS